MKIIKNNPLKSYFQKKVKIYYYKKTLKITKNYKFKN